jgi:CRP/FNR family cyclic AMP-dependent transcriptional regulator
MNLARSEPTSLYSAITEPRLEALARRGELRVFRRHAHLMEEEQAGDDLFILLTGRVRVYATSGGRKPRELTHGICGPGQFVGEMSLHHKSRSASVEALQTTTCALLTREKVMAFIQEEPEFALDLLHRVTERARQANRTVRQVLFLDTYGRLCELLTRNTLALADGRLQLRDRLTHAQMAQQIGCSREMVSRLLKDLIVGGYVQREAEKQYFVCKSLPLRW